MSRLTHYSALLKRLPWGATSARLYNHVKYRVLPRKEVTSVRRYTPQIAGLLVTMRCNLACSFCAVDKVMKNARPEWREYEATVEKVRTIFANPLFKHCLTVELLGGEPLLVKEIVQIVALLAKQGRFTKIVTNGLLLEPRLAELKKAGLSALSISMYRENRKVLERDMAKMCGMFQLETSLVLLRSQLEKNPEELIETVRLASDSGSKAMRMYSYRPMGQLPNPFEVVHEGVPAYTEFRKRVDEAFPHFCSWPSVPRQDRKVCSQLWQRVACDMAGKMSLCCGYDEPLSGPGSNLFDSAPDSCYNHPKMVQMRRELLDPNGPAPLLCRTCELLNDPGWVWP